MKGNGLVWEGRDGRGKNGKRMKRDGLIKWGFERKGETKLGKQGSMQHSKELPIANQIYFFLFHPSFFPLIPQFCTHPGPIPHTPLFLSTLESTPISLPFITCAFPLHFTRPGPTHCLYPSLLRTNGSLGRKLSLLPH